MVGVDIVDNEMEVKRKMRQGEAAGISFWVWLRKKDNSAFPQRFRLFTTKPTLNTPFPFTRKISYDPWALLLTKSWVSSRCCLCSVSFDGGTASSRSTHGFNSAANCSRRTEFRDESSNVFSLGCSATIGIA